MSDTGSSVRAGALRGRGAVGLESVEATGVRRGHYGAWVNDAWGTTPVAGRVAVAQGVRGVRLALAD